LGAAGAVEWQLIVPCAELNLATEVPGRLETSPERRRRARRVPCSRGCSDVQGHSQSLEIEAMVLNRDIGFVRAGQDAQIKIDTFNFSRYGLLHGKVLSVSPDAITHDKPQNKSGNDEARDVENATSEPKGHELVYAARVSLDHEQMQVDDRLVNLSPGMAVTVGTRRIISYLLSPLARYTHDSLRER